MKFITRTVHEPHHWVWGESQNKVGGDAQFVHYLLMQPKLKPDAVSVKRSQFMSNWLHSLELYTIGTVISACSRCKLSVAFPSTSIYDTGM